jgi:signal transduction histidine kinase
MNQTGKYFMLFLTILLLTLAGNAILNNWHYKEGDHRRLQKIINRKFRQTDRIFQKLSENNWQLNAQLPKKHDITIVAYQQDSLIYWSDNKITFNQLLNKEIENKRFDSISSGWYIIKPFTNDSITAYGLILVRSQYPYENDFLENRFQPDLRLPSATKILTEAAPGSFSILDWEGIYLFSIKFNVEEARFSGLEKTLLPILYMLTFLVFLFLMHHLLSRINNLVIRNTAFLFLLVALIFIRWIQYRLHLPADLYGLEWFGPVPFAKSALLPSLGDVFINTFLVLFFIIEFCAGMDLTFIRGSSKPYRNPRILLLMIVLAGFFVYTHYILSSLILHSTISLELYNVAGLNFNTLVVLMIVAIHFASMLLLSNKVLSLCTVTCNFKMLMMIAVLMSILVFLPAYFINYGFDIGSHLAFILMVLVVSVMHYKGLRVNSLTSMAFMAVFFSVYSVYFFTHFGNRKMSENMRVMAENLATQHDPIAEYLFEDISHRMIGDETLKKYMFNLNISREQIHNYLQGNYFNGFWSKYSLYIWDGGPNDSILVNNDTLNVYDYYRNKLDRIGSMQLPGSRFYYLDSLNGKINYLGWITYQSDDKKLESTLFLELESRLTSGELGYPELLLDKMTNSRLLEEYSYARYFKNQLLAQSGTYQYSLDLNTYKDKPEKFDRYFHLIYYLNKDNVVMVSRPSTTLFDDLVSFSYVFLFLYVIAILFVAFRNFSNLGRGPEFNFRNKIQITTITMLLLSLIMVGGGTIYFSIRQYQMKQHDLLSEKIQSVYIELDHLLAYLPNRISPGWRNDDYENLNQLLIRFSDVFYTDINLYDPKGNLLATSRPEIFEQGMLGEKMNPVAYSKMVKEKQPEFIHGEQIGNLSFLSAYVPFVNANNKLLAFLNLPYFTRQNVIRNDLTSLVVAVVNVYVLLLLLTIAMTAIISDQITRPLRLIQRKFSEMKLGKKNEEITYRGHDEIAGLVDEYNRMVRELAKSVELLSRSERESAWREMAKQVAHEIKNPLTPMKLSVQHLLRSWKDNRENFDEFLEKVTRTLIEQIDNLSFIASEFGNFAKMPKAYNEKIDIISIIKTTLNLFTNIENVDFVFEHESEKVMIFADKEQLSRVFINLIKNAIQSIPENRQGKIGISLVLNGEMVRVSITDNGKGIPEYLQNKLFTPSFTTKSSGMGLGLSITKNIIESFNGHITFKTQVNHGTTFVFELPVHLQAVRDGSE